MSNWSNALIRRIFNVKKSALTNSGRASRPKRVTVLTCESLEGRLALSTASLTNPLLPGPPHGRQAGGLMVLESLAYLGITPAIPGQSAIPANTRMTPKLKADIQKLNTDILNMQLKSGVTIGQLQNLAKDGDAINQAKPKLDPNALLSATTNLAMAIADGSFDHNPAKALGIRNQFFQVFAGTKVPQNVVGMTFNQEVMIDHASHATTSDLNTILADQAAIQRDLHGK